MHFFTAFSNNIRYILSEKIIQTSITIFLVQFVNFYTCFCKSNEIKGRKAEKSNSEIQFNYKSLQIHVFEVEQF